MTGSSLQVTRESPQPFHNIVECGTEEVSHVQDGERGYVGPVVAVGVFAGFPKKTHRLSCHF